MISLLKRSMRSFDCMDLIDLLSKSIALMGWKNQSWFKKVLRNLFINIYKKNLYNLDWWMGHWRRSVENLSIMRKVFFYLLCMVLILPSVGMTSLRGFFQMFIDEAQSNHTMPTNSTLKWNCIFL